MNDPHPPLPPGYPRAGERVVPPPVPLPARPRTFRTGFGLGAGAALGVATVAIAGLVITALGLAALVGVATLAEPEQDPVGPTSLAWGEADAEHRILAVPVQGVIFGHESETGGFGLGTYGYQVARTLDDLDADDYDGVVLEMNTPGGTIYGSRAIADAVERYRERTGNQVVAFVQGISASGGMYAMAGADQIVADHGTLVGSIGVIMGPFEQYDGVIAYSGSLFTPGVETTGGITQEYLTAGEGKDVGNPFREITEAEREVLTGGLQREYASFVSWVSQARDIPEATIREDIGAHVYDPQRAAEIGLVDEVGDQSTAFRTAAELNDADPDDTAVYRQEPPGLIASLFGFEAGAGSDEEGTGAAEPSAAVPPGGSSLCSGRRLTLVYHGDLASLCGR